MFLSTNIGHNEKCCYPNYFLKAEYDYDSHEGNAIGYIEAWKNSTL